MPIENDKSATDGRRVIRPDDEVPGGPEASADRMPDVPANPGLGSRAALPEGSLSGPYLGTQGDENRQPPPNAPAPVNPQPTVETVRQAAAGKPGEAGRQPAQPGKATP